MLLCLCEVHVLNEPWRLPTESIQERARCRDLPGCLGEQGESTTVLWDTVLAYRRNRGLSMENLVISGLDVFVSAERFYTPELPTRATCTGTGCQASIIS